MLNTRPNNSSFDPLERLAQTARMETPPDIDVVARVLRALRDQEEAAYRPVAWCAAFAGVGAMAAGVYLITLFNILNEPLAPWFQIGAMIVF